MFPPGAGAPTLPGAGTPTLPGAGAPPAPGAGAPPAMAMAPPMVATSSDPTIPEIKGDCPPLESGSINYMGLTGQIQSGPMPASPTAPMLLYWHGTGSSAGEYAFMAGAIANGVTGEGGVVVSFENTTNKGDCSISGTAIFCAGDFDVMDQYVACAVKNRNVDPHRIYTAGCSAGGLMATAMAAQRAQYIAAATPNSGGMSFPSQFSAMYTPGLMTIHGAPGQDVVVIDFSDSSKSADMIFKMRGGEVVDCNTGGGHCGGGGLAGDAWTFMQAHPYGVDPEPYKAGLPAGFSSQCTLQ
jgi:predicted esterase